MKHIPLPKQIWNTTKNNKIVDNMEQDEAHIIKGRY